MFDKQSFEDKIRKTNDAKQLKSLATSIRVASNRNSISTKDANALIEKANKKAYMLGKVHNADRKVQLKDANYTIKKESGKEAYNVYVNDKRVKTFGSLVDAQKYVRDYKLGRVNDEVPKKIEEKEKMKNNDARKVKDANVKIDYNKAADYLWTWVDSRSIGSPTMDLVGALLREANSKGLDRSEARAYIKENYKKHLDEVYKNLRLAVEKKLKEGYNNAVREFEKL